MVKKIIIAVLVCTFVFFTIPSVNAGAASGLVIKDKDGKSYVSGYNGKSGDVDIPAGTAYIGSKAFKDNIKITSVTVPDGCSVEKNAFENCAALESVTFEGDVPHIGGEAFLNCTSLKKITFKKQSAKVGYIGKKAFVNCFKLETAAFPENTAEIREFAFGNCISLENVTVPKKTSVVDKNAFGYMYDEKTGSYFPADGKTAAYVRYYQVYKGRLLEWYSEQVGEAVTLSVAENSAGENYAIANELSYTHYKSADVPNVTAEAGIDSIMLKWNRIKGADAYRVSILKDGKFVQYKITTAMACNVKELESGRSYTFKVTVLDRIKANKYTDLISTDELTFATNAEEKKAEKTKSGGTSEVPRVSAEATSDSIVLKWNKVDSASAYRVSIYDSTQNKYVQYKLVKNRSCTVTGLQSGTEYRLMVTSVKSEKGKYIAGESTELTVTTGEAVKS